MQTNYTSKNKIKNFTGDDIENGLMFDTPMGLWVVTSDGKYCGETSFLNLTEGSKTSRKVAEVVNAVRDGKWKVVEDCEIIINKYL